MPEGLRITTADVSVPENHNEFIVLTTNQDFNENADVIFSIPSGADIDKFGLDGKDNNVLHFDSDDFEAREDHTYSVEVSRGNTKVLLIYGYSDDFISCLEGLGGHNTLLFSKGSSYLNLINITIIIIFGFINRAIKSRGFKS
jgi:hypothetical protein